MTLTTREVVQSISVRLQEAGMESPRLDARLLVARVLGSTPNEILLETAVDLSSVQVGQVDVLVNRRLSGEPVSRIVGEREFWGLTFGLSNGTLDPRPDSETLVSSTLTKLSKDKDLPLRLLDLGTGTGCLLIALLSELPNASGLGVDIDSDAVSTAKANAKSLGVETRAVFAESDWFSAVEGKFDLIVSNPPYVQDADINRLQREVRLYDPMLALRGGADGLAAYRQLIPQCAQYLRESGLLVLELGAGQSDSVKGLLATSGYREIEEQNDLSGQVRCLTSRLA